MRNFLVMPLQRTRVCIQGDDGVSVQIGSLARLAVEIRCGIANTPINQVQLGIVRPCHPGGTAAMFPTLARPGFVPLFTGAWNGPEAPNALAGLRVKGIEVTAMV